MLKNESERSTVLEDASQEELHTLTLEPEEEKYMSLLKARLQRARDERDTQHEFFDGMTYVQRCEANRRLANSFIAPKKNKEDTNFTTGISRKKMMALLSAVNNLNLEPDITAYNEGNIEESELGEAFEDIVLKSHEIDGDEEKRLLRQYTMFVQGEVFVEENWKEEFIKEKKLKGKYEGKFRGVDWTEKLKKVNARCSRNILRNENVYLGDIRVFGIENQPFIFTVDLKSYEEAEAMYGDWENWKYVSKERKNWSDAATGFSSNLPYWTLTSAGKGEVEIVKYQDKWNNEFQIVINGIPMLPIGFPMPWQYQDYNVRMQVFEVIDEKFAYGRSLMQTLKISQALEDEFWKLIILKGQQSATPPTANNTGKILTSRIFMPGKMIHGIDPDQLKPLMEKNEGPTTAEFNVLKLIRDNIDEKSVNPTFAGQSPEGDKTATEILEVQRQAQMVLGLVVFVSALLEKKLAELRMYDILENWFEPIGSRVDEIRGLVSTYNSINVEKPIEGMGMGQQIIEAMPQEMMPSPLDIFQEENRIFEETGVPTRKVVIRLDEIKKAKYTWRIVVNPTEKKTSNLQKVMFREMINDFLTVSPNINPDWAEERAATVWGENPAKVFIRPDSMMAQPMVAEGMNMPGGPRGQNGTMNGMQNPTPRTKRPGVNALSNPTP